MVVGSNPSHLPLLLLIMVKVNHLSLLLYNLHTSVVALKKNLEVKEIPLFYTSYCMFVVLNLTRIYNVSYNM